MTRFRSASRLALFFSTLAVAGCAAGPQIRPNAAGAAQAAQDDAWRGRGRVRDAIAALNRGDARSARRSLEAVLRRTPTDGIARQLLSQIDGDPRQLLGTESYSYTLKEGETLSTIAQRALGNPLLFYALARYNNIAVPASAAPGLTIQVPGRRPRPPAPRPAPAPAQPRTAPRPVPQRAPDAPAARPAQPAANPAGAARLRAQGLAAMNTGAIDRAVNLLRQAAALDPGNAAIRSDLARAQRIQDTVRARR